MNLLNIETATDICSVCVSKNKRVLALEESKEPFSHTAQLTILIQKALQKAALSLQDMDAVALSSGPGSYTALRVGTSVAKGICYALNKPLIAVDTLKSLALASQSTIKNTTAIYCPMLDARRMEVYTALYDYDLQLVKETHALVVEEGVFSHYRASRTTMIFVGNGAKKCMPILDTNTAERHFLNLPCSASFLVPLAVQAYEAKDFVDIAYYEPNYLKAPNITTPKKRL